MILVLVFFNFLLDLMFVGRANADMVVETKAQIEDYIIWRAMENGIPASHLLAVAKCESSFKNVPNHLYDGEDGRYTAYGPFQILKSTAKRYSLNDRRNPKYNIEMAILIYLNEGLTPWNESKSCWSREIV